MAKPYVSVLMPVYNAEKFIGEAIESILNQTLTNFEFIIIDDASKDDSITIIKSYTDSRIRLLQNEINIGISATLNRGIDIASAELIARMDADDISYPTRLQKQYDFFLAHGDCALLSTWAREITESKEPLWTGEWKSAHYYYSLTFGCWIYHPSVMYKRQAVIAVGKYSVPYCEDYDLWWKLSRSYKMNTIEETLLDYRSTAESLSRVAKRKEYDDALLEQIQRNINYYTNNTIRLTDAELQCLLHNVIPLLEEKNPKLIVNCFSKLEYINNCILERPNINHNREAIKEAAHTKKEWVISTFQKDLSKRKFVMLLIRMGYWRKLKSLIISFAKNKAINSMTGITSHNQT